MDGKQLQQLADMVFFTRMHEQIIFACGAKRCRDLSVTSRLETFAPA
jgi:hypothetical protein